MHDDETVQLAPWTAERGLGIKMNIHSLNRNMVRRAQFRKPKVRRTNPLTREEYC